MYNTEINNMQVTISVSSSTNAKGIMFYNTKVTAIQMADTLEGCKYIMRDVRDIYAYDTYSGLAIKSRSGVTLSLELRRVIAEAIFAFNELRDKACTKRGVNDMYTEQQLKYAEQMAIMG